MPKSKSKSKSKSKYKIPTDKNTMDKEQVKKEAYLKEYGKFLKDKYRVILPHIKTHPNKYSIKEYIDGTVKLQIDGTTQYTFEQRMYNNVYARMETLKGTQSKIGHELAKMQTELLYGSQKETDKRKNDYNDLLASYNKITKSIQYLETHTVSHIQNIVNTKKKQEAFYRTLQEDKLQAETIVNDTKSSSHEYESKLRDYISKVEIVHGEYNYFKNMHAYVPYKQDPSKVYNAWPDYQTLEYSRVVNYSQLTSLNIDIDEYLDNIGQEDQEHENQEPLTSDEDDESLGEITDTDNDNNDIEDENKSESESESESESVSVNDKKVSIKSEENNDTDNDTDNDNDMKNESINNDDGDKDNNNDKSLQSGEEEISEDDHDIREIIIPNQLKTSALHGSLTDSLATQGKAQSNKKLDDTKRGGDGRYDISSTTQPSDQLAGGMTEREEKRLKRRAMKKEKRKEDLKRRLGI
jgi:hypothetical protein